MNQTAAAATLATSLLVATLALVIAMLRHLRVVAELGMPSRRQDQQRRVTVRNVIVDGMPVPLVTDEADAPGLVSALIRTMRARARQARARRILRRAFTAGASIVGAADPDQYAVTAVVRSDGVLEIWLMDENWRTITITSRYRRVHMVHDDIGHLAAAVPASKLAETVAIMALASDKHPERMPA